VAALDRMGVADLADDMPAALAHGPRKRVAMARALVSEPRLLLLDEPASGLNESELPGLGELICELSTQTSVVVIEHRMDLMMSICEEIFVLDFGKVISSGTPAKVQADPAVTAAYLGVDGDAGPEDAQDPEKVPDPAGPQAAAEPQPEAASDSRSAMEADGE
jgi:branched-chain amino acid transport system ATP-binding protein